MLFLPLSFFIIAAALLLVALLFRLGFEQRASQSGLLLALGWPVRRVRRLLVVEGLAVAAVGSAWGVVIGLGYAGLMLAALRSKSWWLGAITTPFLEFHFTVRSLLIGYAAGVLVSAVDDFLERISDASRSRPPPVGRTGLRGEQLGRVHASRWPVAVAAACWSRSQRYWPSPPCHSPASSRRARSWGRAPRC